MNVEQRQRAIVDAVARDGRVSVTELAARYDREGADELTFLDVSASVAGRGTMLDVVRRTAEQVFIPLTVGGGVRSVDDVDQLLRAGADKVSINTSAIARPERFFNSLRAQGATLTATHYLPDHAAIPADAAAFAGDGNLLISEKDAVKTAAWPEALKARTYVVDYRALLPPDLLPALRRKLGV